MRIFISLFIIVAVLSSVLFTVLNSHPVDINFYFGETSAPLSLVLAITLVFGVILGLSPCMYLIVKIKRENKRLSKRIKLTEEEIVNLRNIPIKDNS